MMQYPQFLSEEELTDYKKDTCLFCNERFRTRSKSSSHEEWSGGCYSDHKYTVTTITHYVADLDLNYFSFTFDSQDEEWLCKKREELKKTIIEQKEAYAPLLRQELEQTLQLSKPWEDKRGLALDAIMADYLAEVRHTHRPGEYELPLDKKLEALFHHLQLGDLQLVEKGYNRKGRDSNAAYCPRGLKSHHRCWPYAAVTEPLDLSMPYGELVEPITKNKRFAEYAALFTEIPDIWKETLLMPITLKVQPYNPIDWMVR